jgi:hypothetical protein
MGRNSDEQEIPYLKIVRRRYQLARPLPRRRSDVGFSHRDIRGHAADRLAALFEANGLAARVFAFH